MNLGKILGVANSQHIILRCSDWSEEKTIPEIGDNVFDAEKKRIGNIADVFGPVQKPFISVLPIKNTRKKIESFNDLRGNSLFTLPSKTNTKYPSSKTRKLRKFPTKKKSQIQKSKFISKK